MKSFFEQFAIDVSNPEEIIWFDSEDNEKYIIFYTILLKEMYFQRKDMNLIFREKTVL